jgi:hypothetical protein
MTLNHACQGESQGKALTTLSSQELVANIREHAHSGGLLLVNSRKRIRVGGSEDIGSHFKKARFLEDLTHDANADSSHAFPLRASGVAQSQSLSDISAVTFGSRSLSSFASLSGTSLSSVGSVNNRIAAGLDTAHASEPKHIDLKKLIRSGSVKSAPTKAPWDVGFYRENRVRFDMLSGHTQISPVALERVD